MRWKKKHLFVISLIILMAAWIGKELYQAHCMVWRAAYSANCKSRISQLHIMTVTFNKRGDLELPFHGSWDESTEFWSWRTSLIRHNHSQGLNFHEPWNSTHNFPLLEKTEYAEYFTCPGDFPEEQRASYVAVVGPGTAWTELRKYPPKKLGELSNMILFIETTEPKNHWAEPGDDVSPEDVIRMFEADPGLVKNSKQSRFSRQHYPKYFATVIGTVGSFDEIKDVDELKKRLVIEKPSRDGN